LESVGTGSIQVRGKIIEVTNFSGVVQGREERRAIVIQSLVYGTMICLVRLSRDTGLESGCTLSVLKRHMDN